MTDGERRAPIEHRAANVDAVDFTERIITVIAVPYESPAQVEYRGQTWSEVFSRSAFDGLEHRQGRMPVYSVLKSPVASHDHGGGRLVGKVDRVLPDSSAGLLTDLRISKTPAGDETLELAADDALSPSVGFATRGSDQVLDRSTMTRRINRAFLDHVALLSQPAYAGARVLAVRADGQLVEEASLPRLVTPNLDEFVGDPLFSYRAQT